MLSFNKKYYDSFKKGSYEFGLVLDEILNKKISYSKVVDFGCGSCDFIYGFTQKNNIKFLGMDSHDEIIESKYLELNSKYIKTNIIEPIKNIEKFDISFCLEVLEHINNIDSLKVVNNLIHSSDLIIFSSAHKGQGGLSHINEQDLDYWINVFNNNNYLCFDYLRSKIQSNNKIPYYYKYNTVMFINKRNDKLIKIFGDFQITKNNFKTSLIYKLRQLVIHNINYKFVNILVYVKYVIKKILIRS